MLKQKIENWLNQISNEGSLPSSCLAIYIGMFDGPEEYQIYFMGSTDFDAEDYDWACAEEGDYVPTNKYLPSGIPTSSDWEEFESQVVVIIKELHAAGNSLLNSVKNIGVGHDAGDIIII